MRYAHGHLCLGVVLCLASAAAWADSVTVNTSLGLTDGAIFPATGTLNFLSLTTSTFAQALDSSGDSDSQSSPTSATAATTLASASGTASGSTGTGSVAANIGLPNSFTGFASSAGDSVLSGAFEITGSTNPVSVDFSVYFSGSQYLETSGNGQFASSEVIFSLRLPDYSSTPILFSDSLLTTGPNSVLSSGAISPLTTSIYLFPNTDYSFAASLDAESGGSTIPPTPTQTPTPEPSPIVLLLTAAGLWAAFGKWFTSKSCLPKRI